MAGSRGKKAPAKPLFQNKVDFLTFLELWNAKLGQTTPEHHRRIAEWLIATEGNPQRLLQAFRESGKSWIICLYVAWRLYMDPTDSFILISATQPLATRNANFIREMIENHPLTKHLVPPGETELWRRQSFVVVRPNPMPNPSVQAVALGSDITGLHANELIADDCESSRNSETSESRAQTRERLQEFPSISRRTLWIGTPHAGAESIYVKMIADEAKYHPIQIPIYVEDKETEVRTYAWPELFGPERVQELEEGMTARHFATQYLLELVNMEASGLPVEYVRSYTDQIITNRHVNSWTDAVRVDALLCTKPLVKLIAVYDPSTALPGKDDSVLCVIAQDQDKAVYLHRAIALPACDPQTGWKPQVDKVCAIMKELQITQIVVETNLAKTLPADLRAAAERVNMRIRIKEIHSNTTSKVTRISVALEALMGSGKFHAHESVLNDTPFRQQAMDFPASVKRKGAKDDFIDCAALGVAALNDTGRYTGSIGSGSVQVSNYRLNTNR